MLPRFAALVVLAVVCIETPAHADVGDSDAGYDPGRAQRRSDFAAGFTFGGAFGQAAGYPNELSKINVPAYQADTGFGAGMGGSAWIGAALRDWLTFGVGAQFLSVSGKGYTSSGAAFILHLEGYPLFSQGGAFRDLGLIGEFGAGGRGIRKDSDLAAEGGTMSLISLGVVYEPLRLGGHLSGGPIVQLTHQWSDSLSSDILLAGIRLAFYGGPS